MESVSKDNKTDKENSFDDSDLEEDVIIEKHSPVVKYSDNKMQENIYIKFIILSIIIAILTVLALFVEKIKNWFKKQNKRKLIITSGVTISGLLIIVVFGFKFNASMIKGTVYDIDSIGSNIDNLQVGDTINYTANGYSDWEVLNINKEDNTLEIVSKTSVEDVAINCVDEQCSNYHDVLQETANKYLDGKYAIISRSVQ